MSSPRFYSSLSSTGFNNECHVRSVESPYFSRNFRVQRSVADIQRRYRQEGGRAEGNIAGTVDS